MLSAGINVAASQGRIPKGGYGMTGLCIDAVACVQACVEGKTSLYPLAITGEGKVRRMGFRRTAPLTCAQGVTCVPGTICVYGLLANLFFGHRWT